ncbi:hypothetical protein DB35_10095 [Streptomyces abyssalis]|uniref:Uncharacterized protein n=1 Tax=Streptomyces abyssalis TaxID=933944 RepID=A0A1E7JJ24_9ACTN|nr:DUF6099 family protein [Streptomyces abyssalis]OEU86450.1 hypothetical protein AN215_27795 [Streptomyces abyssalis]OEU93197.1 hypothetical protein DB35_10095 [Streptomyces abyssalis]OEV27915.1 hypothetical protein AN219_21730 [Streptomyces nanshensis]
MDAVHLIKATRHALAECESVEDIIAESWQVQALAGAIGSHLAAGGPQSVRVEALGLSEAGARACRACAPSGLPAGEVCEAHDARADRLSQIQDAKCALSDLSGLLAEAGVALVLVAVTAREEGLYWQCIEAIDAADESQDRVSAILRRLEVQEHGPAA